MQDTVEAARSVQGIFPDLCQQVAFVAMGCQLPYWSECNPPPHVEKVRLEGVIIRSFKFYMRGGGEGRGGEGASL